MCVCSVASVMSDSLQPHGLQPTTLSMGFSRQENWSRLPCPPPGDLPNPGIEPTSSLAGEFFTTSATWEAQAVGIGTITKNTNESNDDDNEKANTY